MPQKTLSNLGDPALSPEEEEAMREALRQQGLAMLLDKYQRGVNLYSPQYQPQQMLQIQRKVRGL